MDLRDLVIRNRSYRRFHQDHAISEKILRHLIELARFSASGANVQPLRFVLSNTRERNAAIFEHLAWAGYLTDWDGPEEGERPSAYVVIVSDTTIKMAGGCDHGIAAQSILLGATEQGLGGCMIGAIDKDGLRAALGLPEPYDILLVIALGKPKERVVLEDVGEDGSIKYWRDEEGVHHVPKRPLGELILDV
ncbi:MAG TPA: nitroreductase family protein [Candidatus Hydrogenedentes bacterium]|nr:nitroreductase family protein [Candidatus Hydrogenedentota bacterium]